MISNKRLKQLVSYNPDTGVFTWLNPNKGKARAGDIIKGWNAGKGYAMVGLDFHRYYLHRLAWQYVYGEYPSQIDHINCNVRDNRICNLRECSSSQNSANMRGRSKTGAKGAYREKRTGRYYSSICLNGKQKHLGTFDTKEEANAAYAKAAVELFGEFARAE